MKKLAFALVVLTLISIAGCTAPGATPQSVRPKDVDSPAPIAELSIRRVYVPMVAFDYEVRNNSDGEITLSEFDLRYKVPRRVELTDEQGNQWRVVPADTGGYHSITSLDAIWHDVRVPAHGTSIATITLPFDLMLVGPENRQPQKGAWPAQLRWRLSAAVRSSSSPVDNGVQYQVDGAGSTVVTEGNPPRAGQ